MSIGALPVNIDQWKSRHWYQFFMRELNKLLDENTEDAFDFMPLGKSKEEQVKNAYDSLITQLWKKQTFAAHRLAFSPEVKRRLLPYVQKRDTRSLISMVLYMLLIIAAGIAVIWYNYEHLSKKGVGGITATVAGICLIVFIRKRLIKKGLRDAIVRACVSMTNLS